MVGLRGGHREWASDPSRSPCRVFNWQLLRPNPGIWHDSSGAFMSHNWYNSVRSKGCGGMRCGGLRCPKNVWLGSRLAGWGIQWWNRLCRNELGGSLSGSLWMVDGATRQFPPDCILFSYEAAVAEGQSLYGDASRCLFWGHLVSSIFASGDAPFL